MRVDITFDRQKVERQGYPLAAVWETVKQNFEARGLRCIQEEDTLSFTGSGSGDDFADLWAVIMGLLRTDWFPALAASCVWQDDSGAREDVLSQAWKVRDRRVT